ncbi:porin family protein [Xanthovirga aplysinae]|uniref:porin family protein n=1 Tax=Xanthovirga aplysinae TaxID=2529853 RepID=UPI0012BC3546|nr:porin family protein [Xanthovirga aplysinae]MTI31236.1 PorT family protein [Xanthovirga aplysinae]
MKKTITIFLSCFLLASFSKAQELNLGVRAGLNYAGYIAEGEGSARVSTQFGAFANTKFGMVILQPEALISLQGAKASIPSLDAMNLNSDFTDRITYLNLLLIAKINIFSGFNLQAGPQYGYVLAAKRDFKKNDLALGPALRIQDGDIVNLNKYDLSFNFGIGYDIGRFDIAARYNLGLKDLKKDKKFVPNRESDEQFRLAGGTEDIKNQLIYISLGYKLF